MILNKLILTGDNSKATFKEDETLKTEIEKEEAILTAEEQTITIHNNLSDASNYTNKLASKIAVDKDVAEGIDNTTELGEEITDFEYELHLPSEAKNTIVIGGIDVQHATKITGRINVGIRFPNADAENTCDFPKLKEFDLSNSTNVDIPTSPYLTSSTLEKINLKNCSFSNKALYFGGCTSLKEIDLDNTDVESINIVGCTSIESIKLPPSTTSIPASAFSSCTDLETIDTSECNKIASVGVHAFADCDSLTKLDLSNNVITDSGITNGLFNAGSSLLGAAEDILENLEELDLSNNIGITNIDKVFYSTSSSVYGKLAKCLPALKKIDLRNTSISGDSNIFHAAGLVTSGNSVIEEVYLPNSFTTLSAGGTLGSGEVPYGAFCECTNLTKLNLEDTKITTIPIYAFYKCEKLTSLKFPSTLATIGVINASYPCFEGSGIQDNFDFSGATNLSTIGYGSFADSGIANIDLRNTKISKIYTDAFKRCTIKKLYLPSRSITISKDVFTSNLADDAEIYFDGTTTQFYTYVEKSSINAFVDGQVIHCNKNNNYEDEYEVTNKAPLISAGTYSLSTFISLLKPLTGSGIDTPNTGASQPYSSITLYTYGAYSDYNIFSQNSKRPNSHTSKTAHTLHCYNRAACGASYYAYCGLTGSDWTGTNYTYGIFYPAYNYPSSSDLNAIYTVGTGSGSQSYSNFPVTISYDLYQTDPN